MIESLPAIAHCLLFLAAKNPASGPAKNPTRHLLRHPPRFVGFLAAKYVYIPCISPKNPTLLRTPLFVFLTFSRLAKDPTLRG